jgi:crotonobetainyl-CoA:carnitine CoA-transferase CaiB-like acyl-CoA transferase
VTTPPADLPLTGIGILSLAEQYPGPYETMLLAYLGAEVTLVERPKGGDPGWSGHFAAPNRNKRPVALDLKADRGLEASWRLAATADVVTEGFKRGIMRTLGLGPDDVRCRFPHVTYVSISSFGQSGPLSALGGHDISMLGMAGLINTAPRKTASLGDLSSRMFAAFATVCALVRKERCGQGTTVDVSMLDCLVSRRSTMLVLEVNGLDPAPYPPDNPGYGVFETSTRALIALSMAGRTISGPPSKRPRISANCGARSAPWTHPNSYGRCPTAGSASARCTPAARCSTIRRWHPAAYSWTPPGSPHGVLHQPVLLDGDGGTVRSGAPCIGQHTARVLGAAGYSPDDLIDLARSGAIANDALEESAWN